MIRTDVMPEFLKSPYPLVDRPRTPFVYGVTEILYCLRKSYLTRVVPAPTAVSFEQRRNFSRGRSLEESFFGPDQKPIHFRGGMVGVRDFSNVEGHTDHSDVDENGVPSIVEFKTTKHLWLSHPDGRKCFNVTQAKKYMTKDDIKLLELQPMQSHVDQLKLYMMLNEGIKRGVLIYFEMDSNSNYVFELTDADISEEFKDTMKSRLDELDAAFKDSVVPQKSPGYDFECKLCNFMKNGICQLCDQGGFNVDEFIADFQSRGDPHTFMVVVGEWLDKFNLSRSLISSFDENGT